MKIIKTALILMILLACNLTLSADIPAWERQALIDLYNSTNGASWTDSTNWLGAVGTENTWWGVGTGRGNTNVLSIYLPDNNLVGTLPASLGNLSNLDGLYLDNNQLTGSIPSSFGNLSNLTWLSLFHNQLTGSIPTELGNLSNLQLLFLGDPMGSGPSNQLTGSIPTELGNLSNLQELYLGGNQLTGSIPPSLGNLSKVIALGLSSNQLTGSIPTSLTNLTLLSSSQSNIGYNALHTTDAGLIKFLNAKVTGWASTQTIAPTNVSAVPGNASVSVSWTPITYTGNTGGYRVFYATVAGGPYTFYAQTANKSVSSQVVTGLTPGIPYYFVVQARTDAHIDSMWGNNQNVVTSENSAEVLATPAIPAATITVTSPNGGEIWVVGSAHNITWTSTGSIANVKIESSTNGGTGWTTVIASTANNGTYSWTVPNTPSTQSLVRVSEASTGMPVDMSNAVFSIVSSSALPAAERQALIDLYNSTNGASWTTKTNWLGAAGTENTWYGVTTDAGNTTVLQLDLTDNNLVGTIPSSLGTLSGLTDLRLSSNQLTGSIPTSLGNLSNLQILFLDSNQLTGSIPTELGNLSNLQFLHLYYNELTGSIPSSLGNLSNLINLLSSFNQLTGSIPTELGNLSNLQLLYLNCNQLTGSIPSSLGNLSNLVNFYLYSNQLTGSIPTELGNLSNLTHLELSSNQLTGSIPSSLGNLSNLTDLWLTANQLTGTIPTQLGNLSNLQQLGFDYNRLTGSIPASLGNLSNLTWLALHFNQLTGSIPSSLGNLSNLTWLGLCSNQLTGSVPTELGNLSNLQSLYLGSNQLTGSIPSSLGNLNYLTSLSICYTQLTGSIPSSLGNLSILNTLDLHSNQLTGSIPASLGNCYYLQQLYLNSTQLTGSIPSTLTNLTQLVPTNTDFGYNAVYTSDAGLITFLNSKDPDWAATQTIAPTLGSAVPGNASVSVSWTPITYTGDTGGYRVFYGTVAGGPYTFYAQTANKSVSSQLVTGLSNGIPYYFVVQTRTDAHSNNQNVVDSENSAEVLATPAISATITVTSPNGGESWLVGSAYNITWTTAGTIGNFKLEYSTDGGATYAPVIASTPNSGTYAWTVPNTPSTTCMVKASDAANAAVNDASNAVFSIVTEILPPRIALSKTSLAFGAVLGGASTLSQPVIVSNSGGGTLDWSASKNKTWLGVLPVSGTGDTVLTVTVNASGLARGTYTGAVTITAPGATNSPQAVLVTIKVYRNGISASPFGVVDTPINGSTVMGSIPVSGWALDDIEVTKVEIRRNQVAGDPPAAIGLDGLVYLGDATFNDGARPDVEAAWPGIPLNYRAGWGYMLLTYGLPDHGNGTFVLHAVAFDKDGHRSDLGARTIGSDNAHNDKPFGAIDTPGQGATVSGNAYVNFGWVLTPPPAMVPIDGSTIWLWIDSVRVGHPTYNNYRADVHDAYPDYLNADGAVGFYYINTTAYADGMHTIGWSAMDDQGKEEGMGSRFFWVFNGSSGAGAAGLGTGMTRAQENAAKADPARTVRDVLSPVYVRRGFRDAGTYEVMNPDALGVRNYEMEEIERIVMALDSPDDLPSAGSDLRGKSGSARDAVGLTGAMRWSGYLAVGDELRPLPVGSTLDPRQGVFYWQPGPGFLGEYRFVFVDGRDGKKKFVTLNVRPKNIMQR